MAYSKDSVFKCSEKMNEDRDCSVKALALTTHLSYEKAHQILKEQGRKPRRGVPMMSIQCSFAMAGYKLVDVTSKINAKTVKSFGNLKLPKTNKYLISTSGHIVAARSNNVLDWTKWRQHRIKRVYRGIKMV